ncbi:MAG: hypothetical protein QOF98_2009, partial [Streptomyces sp.]|nr:hypothetical protein [Streptomyces sp.]
MTTTSEQNAAAVAAGGRSSTGPRRRRGRYRGFNSPTPAGLVGRYVTLVVVLLISVGPLLWELSTSL